MPLDRCIFTPTQVGVADFVVANPVLGYMTPTAAGAVNGQFYNYVASSSDNTQWEVGKGLWNSVSQTLQRYKILFSSTNGAIVSFNGIPNVALDVLAEDFATLGIQVSGIVGDGVADDTAAIQAAVAAATAVNGCDVRLPPHVNCKISQTIVINNSNVRLIGAGGDTNHDGGNTVTPSTKLTWGGASGGTMVQFATPFASTSSTIVGVGMEKICLEGAGLANIGLLVTSVRVSKFSELMVRNCLVDCYKFNCGVTGLTDGEAADNGNNRIERCFFRVIDTSAVQNCNGFHLTGSSNANTSFNVFENCRGEHWNGAGFLIDNADNNTFISCAPFRAGGTGYDFDCWAVGAGGSGFQGGNFNYFVGCSWGNTLGIIFRGTEQSGATSAASQNNILTFDVGNSAGAPVLGTGSDYITPGPYWKDFSAGVTITPTSGAFTTLTVNRCRYHQSGTLVHYFVDFTITNNGTGAGSIKINLPLQGANFPGIGMMHGVDQGTGDWCGGHIDGNNNWVVIQNYTGAYNFATGSRVMLEGFYESLVSNTIL